MPLALDRLATDLRCCRWVVQREMDLARETGCATSVVVAENTGAARTHGAAVPLLATRSLAILPSRAREPGCSGSRVVMERGAVSRHWDEQVCRIAGFEPDVRFETSDLHVLIRLIQSGHAVGIVPDLLWSGTECEVRLVDLPGVPTRRVFTSAREASALSPAILACRDSLAAAAASLTRE